MLKRSDATAILPNQSVFPGGLLDTEGDESVAWLEYFEQFGIAEAQLRRLILISENRPGLLAPQGTGCYDRFFKRSKIWARLVQSANHIQLTSNHFGKQRDNTSFNCNT